MTDLSEFLLARYAEDEAVARDAAGWRPSGRERSPGQWQRDGLNSVVDSDRQSVVYGDGGPPSDGAVEHITRWDPARVLAECETKRLIVEAEPERWVLQPDAPGSTVDMGCPDGMVRVYGKLITELEYRDRYMELAPPSQTLLYLALPYADHPDYREEWRP